MVTNNDVFVLEKLVCDYGVADVFLGLQVTKLLFARISNMSCI